MYIFEKEGCLLFWILVAYLRFQPLLFYAQSLNAAFLSIRHAVARFVIARNVCTLPKWYIETRNTSHSRIEAELDKKM